MMTRRARRAKRVVRVAAMVFLVVVPISLLVLWMMFQHRPPWYRVPKLDESDLRDVRAETARLVDSISEHMVHKKSIDVFLDQEKVNQWLASLYETWPGSREALPKEVDDWVVSFEPSLLRLGGHYDDGTWRAILSAGFVVKLSEDGRSVIVALRDISGGSLDMPEWGLQYLLKQLRNSIAALRDVETIEQLKSGVAIRNRFVWPNGKRPIRISKIEFADGSVELTLEPL